MKSEAVPFVSSSVSYESYIRVFFLDLIRETFMELVSVQLLFTVPSIMLLCNLRVLGVYFDQPWLQLDSRWIQ